MTTERCFELFGDCELQQIIRDECGRRFKDAQMQRLCFIAAWSWISRFALDDIDGDALRELVAKVIDHHLLATQRLTRGLLDICGVEYYDPLEQDRQRGHPQAGTIVQPRRRAS